MNKVNYNCRHDDSGIYKIVCIPNNKVYIGSSHKIGYRASQHKTGLLNNKHPNPHLQAAYNKYGVDSFYFELLELCPISDILIKEQYYIDLYEASNRDKGYNIRIVAENSLGIKKTVEQRIIQTKALQKSWDEGKRNKHNPNLWSASNKPVEEYYKGVKTNIYKSATDASKAHNISNKVLHSFMSGRTKKIKALPDYNFKYIESMDNIQEQALNQVVAVDLLVGHY